VVTSYSNTIGPSLTVFAVLRLVTDKQIDGRTDGIGLAECDTKEILRVLSNFQDICLPVILSEAFYLLEIGKF